MLWIQDLSWAFITRRLFMTLKNYFKNFIFFGPTNTEDKWTINNLFVLNRLTVSFGNRLPTKSAISWVHYDYISSFPPSFYWPPGLSYYSFNNHVVILWLLSNMQVNNYWKCQMVLNNDISLSFHNFITVRLL